MKETQLTNRTIWNLREQGETYTEIGKLFGISHERARQIYSTHIKHIKRTKQYSDGEKDEF